MRDKRIFFQWALGVSMMSLTGVWLMLGANAQIIMPELPQIMVSIPLTDAAKPLTEEAPAHEVAPAESPEQSNQQGPQRFELQSRPNEPKPAEFVPSQTDRHPKTISTPVVPTQAASPPPAHTSSVTNVLNLTKTQKVQLKALGKNFVADNQAAFDSLRIKRYLINQLKAPQEALQRSELQTEVQQELALLKRKKEATLQYILNAEQYSKLQAHRLKLQAEKTTQQAKERLHASTKAETPKAAEKHADQKLSREIKNLPRYLF